MSCVSTNEFYVSCTRRLSQLLPRPPDAEFMRKLWLVDDLGELKNFLYGYLQKNNSDHRKFVGELVSKWKTRGPISGSGDFVVYKKSDIVDEFAVRSKPKKPAKQNIKHDDKPQKSAADKEKSGPLGKTKDAQTSFASEPDKQNLGLQTVFPPRTSPPKPETIISPSGTSRSHEKKPKSKFVPLFSAKGQARAVVHLPGRHSCECQAIKHPLISNCTGCGRIVCAQEGSGPCYFCGKLVCTREEQNILNVNDKKSEQLLAKLMGKYQTVEVPTKSKDNKKQQNSANLEKGLQKAVEMKDRLLEFDRTSQKRTKVIDDEADYYVTDSNQWLTKEERAKMSKLQQSAHEKKHASRRSVAVTLDFAGRKVIEEEVRFAEINADDVLSETTNYQDMINQTNFNKGSDIPRPEFDESVCESHQKSTVKHQKENLSRRHKLINQDKDLQEMFDEGLCLSLHQPYASLLVCGLKKHEGRTWYTPFRGLLWIASATKEPSPQEIKQIESTVKVLQGDHVKFPERYPVSALLGCVNVIDCLPQETYREQYPDGESSSPYVFICENMQELLVKFPIKGNHKIYKLEPHIHQAAKKTIKKSHSEM